MKICRNENRLEPQQNLNGRLGARLQPGARKAAAKREQRGRRIEGHGGHAMRLTLEYWADEGGYVGRLREIPGVFSQGDTLNDLEENIRDAYELVLEDARAESHPAAQLKSIEVPA